jgi:hypothetical protein
MAEPRRSSSPAETIPTSTRDERRSWFRLHPRDHDPHRLLDPERQRSEPWGGTIYGRCMK